MVPCTAVTLRRDNAAEKASSQRSSLEMMKLGRNCGNAGIISQALSCPFQKLKMQILEGGAHGPRDAPQIPGRHRV